MLPAVGVVRPWADPHVVSIDRLDMRPPTSAVASVEAARAAEARSPWRRSLDGRWAFRLFDSPDAVPASAVERPPTGRSWSSVAVPGNWTLQGVGDGDVVTIDSKGEGISVPYSDIKTAKLVLTDDLIEASLAGKL